MNKLKDERPTSNVQHRTSNIERRIMMSLRYLNCFNNRIKKTYLMPTKSLFFAAAMFSCPPVYPKKLPKRIYYESIAYKWNDL